MRTQEVSVQVGLERLFKPGERVRLLPVAQQIYSSLAHLRSGKGFLADVLDLLDQPLPAHADAPLPPPLPFQHAITFDHVGFRYAPEAPWVLKDLNLTIRKGNRDLNYAKYLNEGDHEVSVAEDYTSHNTQRLDKEQVRQLLLGLDFIKDELNA